MKNLILTSFLLSFGCGKKPGSYNVQAKVATEVTEAKEVNLAEKADALWPERGDKEKLGQALEIYEQAFAVDNTNKHVSMKASIV